MAGFTDAAFRRICGSFGADYAVSEMISAVALTRDDAKTAELAKITPGEPPVVLQIFGRDPAVMARAAGSVKNRPVSAGARSSTRTMSATSKMTAYRVWVLTRV